MLHLYTGPDDFRMREAYARLRASLDVDGMLETNTTLLPPRGLRVDELIQHAMTAPFMAEARVVGVSDDESGPAAKVWHNASAFGGVQEVGHINEYAGARPVRER